MDKKLAEEEARKKAKDERHAAGKSSGMSGRDLVRAAVVLPAHYLTHYSRSVYVQPGVVRGR